MTHSTLSDDIKALAAGYVLDELEPEELFAFEQMMQTDNAIRQEVRELQILLGGMAMDVPPLSPPAHLRTQTLAALGIVDEPPAIPVSDQQTATRKKIDWGNVTAVFAILSAIALLLDNLRLRFPSFSLPQWCS